MPIVDKIKEIQRIVVSLEEDILSPDESKSKAAKEQYLALVNQFSEINRDLLAYSQCEAIKTDYEYFLRLLELSIMYWQEEETKKVKARLH